MKSNIKKILTALILSLVGLTSVFANEYANKQQELVETSKERMWTEWLVEKPVEKRAQGLLESARNAEKTSAGIVPPPKEEPNTEGKTFGVLDQKKYESKVVKEERKEVEKAAKEKRQS